MKWVHEPENEREWEAWLLKPEDESVPVDVNGAVLYLINFELESKVWTVTVPSTAGPYDPINIGELPFDMPEEELHAMAIAMWRLA